MTTVGTTCGDEEVFAEGMEGESCVLQHSMRDSSDTGKAAEVFCVSNSWEEDGRENTGVEERTVGGNE